MFRISWGIASVFSLAMLVGILVVTRDLSVTNDLFKDGVVQAKQVDRTTDKALGAAGQLPPADDAINEGFPQVVSVLGSLTNAESTLGTLGSQLTDLGGVLGRADPPLVGIISAAKQSTDQAQQAARPAAGVVGLLGEADTKVQRLGPMLDETETLSRNIESKLHALVLVPGN